MTSAGDFLPQIAIIDDLANFRDVARWKEVLYSMQLSNTTYNVIERAEMSWKRIQRSREGKIRMYNNVDSVFECRTNVNLDSNWLENYIYRNNVYFNAIREIRNDKENLRAIHMDTKKMFCESMLKKNEKKMEI
uniref:Uncharacterized protein n=1 Tax=Vespula pensylvanica TaxID=30213 RepID=A0A834JMX6_VESPE|nr:hypothetical protein H0235_017608 [Vespula pensylvanica]